MLNKGTRRSSRNQNLIAHMQIDIFYQELRHSNLGEILHALAHIDLHFRCLRTIHLAPLAQTLSLVVAIPEATVEHGGKLLVPTVLSCFILMETAIEHGIDGFIISRHHGFHIFRSAGTSFNLEHTHACIHHHIDEAYRLQVFWRHDIFIVHLQLRTCLHISHLIATTTNLHAFPSIG